MKPDDMKNLLKVFHVCGIQGLLDKRRQDREEQEEKSFGALSFGEKIWRIIDYPCWAAMYLTVLPCDEEKYSKMRCLVWPIPGVLFAMFIFHPELSWHYLYIGAPVIVLFYALFVFTLEEGKAPRWFMLMVVMSVASCMMWMFLLTELLIEMLTMVGIVLDLDNSLIGFTILAVGNALPDALTTLSLAKGGQATMAISGGYAGQLFGLLIGFGLSMLK